MTDQKIKFFLGEPYKTFGKMSFHLSKTFIDKGEAFEYVKLLRSQDRPDYRVFAKLDTVRSPGIIPIYHVYVRRISAINLAKGVK